MAGGITGMPHQRGYIKPAGVGRAGLRGVTVPQGRDIKSLWPRGCCHTCNAPSRGKVWLPITDFWYWREYEIEDYHDEVEIKWPPFHTPYLAIDVPEHNLLYLYPIFTDLYF